MVLVCVGWRGPGATPGEQQLRKRQTIASRSICQASIPATRTIPHITELGEGHIKLKVDKSAFYTIPTGGMVAYRVHGQASCRKGPPLAAEDNTSQVSR